MKILFPVIVAIVLAIILLFYYGQVEQTESVLCPEGQELSPDGKCVPVQKDKKTSKEEGDTQVISEGKKAVPKKVDERYADTMPETCNEDRECPYGYYCFADQQKCVKDCSENKDCEYFPKECCNKIRGFCNPCQKKEPKKKFVLNCKKDEDCLEAYICDPYGFCNIECSSKKKCPFSLICEKSPHPRCVMPPDGDIEKGK